METEGNYVFTGGRRAPGLRACFHTMLLPLTYYCPSLSEVADSGGGQMHKNKETDKQRDRDRHRQTDRETKTETERDRQRQREKAVRTSRDLRKMPPSPTQLLQHSGHHLQANDNKHRLLAKALIV